MGAFSPARDPERTQNSAPCEQLWRLISAGSDAGSLQVISARRPRRYVLPIPRNAIEIGSLLSGWAASQSRSFPFKCPLAHWGLTILRATRDTGAVINSSVRTILLCFRYPLRDCPLRNPCCRYIRSIAPLVPWRRPRLRRWTAHRYSNLTTLTGHSPGSARHGGQSPCAMPHASIIRHGP
jgi:hypothetical protein